MKKLNNKGFTLIELLAVIVILAVVMGVAATSVLSAMNNSRKSSLQNSAASAADAFRTAYAEYSMLSTNGLVGHKDASGDTTNADLIGGTAQDLSKFADGLNITAANYDLTNSFVYFDTEKSSFTVCMVANPTGSYYVAAAAVNPAKSTKVGSKSLAGMWACSNNETSW